MNLIQRILFKVGSGRYVGRVRPVKTNGQKQRLARLRSVMLLKQRYGGAGAQGVGVFALVVVKAQPAQGAPELARRQGMDPVVHFTIDTARVDDVVPRERIVQTVGTDLPGYAIVKYLTYPCGIIAVLPEPLGQGRDLGNMYAKGILVREHTGLLGVQSGQKTDPAGVADRILAVRAVKAHSPCGEAVNMGLWTRSWP